MPDRAGSSTGRCLDAEQLSAYVDGALDVRERALVEAHLASCAECYDAMSEVLRIQEAVPAARPATDASPASPSTFAAWAVQERRDTPAPVPRPDEGTVVRGAFGRRKAVWGIAGGLLAAAAALVLVVRLQPTWWTGGIDPKLADLVEAVGEERTVEARLTGGFKYGPLRSPMRSGGRVGPTDNWALLAAAGRIREEAEKNPTPENLHANGVGHLLLGASSEAVELLERASGSDPSNPDYLADLAAAYLARGSEMDSAADAGRAAEAAGRALSLKPCMPEASFTSALALERLGAKPVAMDAWEDLLRCDGTDGWAAEAREHLSRLRDGVQPQSSRRPLLVPWLLDAQNDSAGAASPATTESTGCRAPDVGDALSQAVLSQWCGARAGGNVDLVDAIESVVRSAELVEEDRRSAAAVQLATVEGRLPAGTAVEILAAVLRHITLAESRRALSSIDALLTASRFAQTAGYLRLASTGYSFAALFAARDGRHEEALQAREAAREVMKAAGERSHYAEQEALVGEHHRYLGDFEAAWRSHVRSLTLLGNLADARSRHVVLAHAGLTAEAMGLPRLAVALQSALVSNADEWAYPPAIVASRTQRARTAKRLNVPDIATHDVEVARMALAGIEDEAYRLRVAAELHAMESEVLQGTSPARAALAAGEAIAGFAHLGYDMRLLPLSYTAALSLRRSGKLDEAEETLLSGVEAFGSHLKTSFDPYVGVVDDTMEKIASELVTIRTLRADPPSVALAALRMRSVTGAVDAARLMRVRELSCAHGRACDVASPSHSNVVTYVETDDRVIAFVAAAGRTRQVHATATGTEIARLVREARNQLQIGRYPRAALARLYDALFSGVADGLSAGELLAIAPSRSLVGLPFVALLNERTGRSLVDDWRVVVLGGEGKNTQTRPPFHRTVAVIGGHPGQAGKKLTRLLDEVDTVAAAYSDITTRVAPRASESDLVMALAQSDIVHYAGHAIVPDRRPDLATLLLWRNGEADSIPVFRMLRSARVTATTVVLAACRTASGMDQSGRATYGLAARLIAAGVENVVGTLWDVPDADMNPIMARLHTLLGAGRSVVDALRDVQLEIRQDRQQARMTWAALTVISAQPSGNR